MRQHYVGRVGLTLMNWLGYEGEARAELYAREHHILKQLRMTGDWIYAHGYPSGPAAIYEDNPRWPAPIVASSARPT